MTWVYFDLFFVFWVCSFGMQPANLKAVHTLQNVELQEDMLFATQPYNKTSSRFRRFSTRLFQKILFKGNVGHPIADIFGHMPRSDVPIPWSTLRAPLLPRPDWQNPAGDLKRFETFWNVLKRFETFWNVRHQIRNHKELSFEHVDLTPLCSSRLIKMGFNCIIMVS